MAAKITKKVRERAAEMLQIIASARAQRVLDIDLGDLVEPDNLDDIEASQLAYGAFMKVPNEGPWKKQWAEAESWVRCGWSEEDDEREFVRDGGRS